MPPEERLSGVPLDRKVMRSSWNNNRRVVRIASFLKRLTYAHQTGRNRRISVAFPVYKKHRNFDLRPQGQWVEVAHRRIPFVNPIMSILEQFERGVPFLVFRSRHRR